MKHRSIKAEFLFICILLMNIFILFFNKVNLFGTLSFFNICFIYFILFIILPFLKHIKKEQFSTKSIRILTLLRILAGTAFYFTLYQVYFSMDYTLQFTYYILIIAALLTFFVHFTDLLVDLLWSHKHAKKNYLLPFVINLLVTLCLFILVGNILYNYLSIPNNRYELKEVQVPTSITLYKNLASADLNKSEKSASNIVIKDPNDIQTIMNNFNNSLIRSFTPANLMNYYRMKEDNHPIYTLVFTYGKKGGFDDNYIPSLEVTSNRFSVIETRQSKSDILFGTFNYDETYPVSLSDDTLTLFFNYVKLIKDK